MSATDTLAGRLGIEPEFRDARGRLQHVPEHVQRGLLLAMGVPAVLLKGGHLESDTVIDLLATASGIEAFAAPRIETRHTHGTGCTTASAVAAGLAQGMSLRDAVIRARAYVRAAITAAPGYGQGHGPLDHAVTVDLTRLATS